MCDSMTGGGSNFNDPAAWEQHQWSTTEADRKTIAPLVKVIVKNVRVWLDTAPGVGQDRTFVGRKNAATPGGAPSITISGTDTTGLDSTGKLTIQ